MKVFSQKLMDACLILSVPAVLFSLGLIFFYAPEEQNQGLVQKIFYFHVSSAFAMYLGFGLAGLFAFFYLIRRQIWMDCLSQAGVHTGLLFCTMVLASGPLWARPVWGTYWTWEPRLTTTLILWLVFFSAYLLRKFYGNDRRGRVFSAVFTLIGILDMPLVFLSVKLWRGIHPNVLGKEGNMPPSMLTTLLASNVAVLLLFSALYGLRARLLLLEEEKT